MSNRRNPLAYRYSYSISWPHICCYGYEPKSLIVLHQVIGDKIGSNTAITHYGVEINQGRSLKLKLFSIKPAQKLGIDVPKLSALISKSYKEKIAKLNNGMIKIDSDPLKISIDIKPSPVNSAARIAKYIEERTLKRSNVRAVITKCIKNAIDNGAEGVKIIVKGRLGGAEMSSTDKFIEGRMPLATIKAVIDYASIDIKMHYGVIGLKVFVYHYNSTSVQHKALH